MPAYEDAVSLNSNLVRKVLQGTVLLAPWPDNAEITTLADAEDGIQIPSGYEETGWLSEDGLVFTRDEEVTQVNAWGAASVLRRDIQSTTKSLQFAALETKRITKELSLGMDLSSTTMDANGQLVITEPTNPTTKYWRVLAIGTDGIGDQRYYFARHFAKGSVTERDDESWTNGDEPLSYNVTMEANLDDDAGFSVREFLFGPGALAAAEAMGWSVDAGGA